MSHRRPSPGFRTDDRSGAINKRVAGPGPVTERPSKTRVGAITARRAVMGMTATLAIMAACFAAVTALGLAGTGVLGVAAASTGPESGPAFNSPVEFRAPVGSLEHASDALVESPAVDQAGQLARQAEPEAGAAESDPAQSGETITPEDLSTGPVLEWTEIDPGYADMYNFESFDDGRVLARAWSIEDELVLDGKRAVYTDDGDDFVEVPLPEGLVVGEIDASGERWVAHGYTHGYTPGDAGSVGNGDLVDRVFFTDDRGATWTELNLDIPPDSMPASSSVAASHCDRYLLVESAATSGDGIVVDLWGYRVLDVHGLLAERGLVPEGRTVLGWRQSTDDTTIFPLARRFASDPGVDPSTVDSEVDHLEFTPEEIGFTPEEWLDVCPPVPSMRLLWSDGATMQLAESPEVSIDEMLAFDAYAADNGFAVTAVNDVLRVQRIENGQLASTAATFEGLFPTGTIAAGAAGVAVTAFPSLGGQLEASTIGGLPTWRDPDRISESPEVPLWLGWSADGIDWGWQSLPEAFGITEGESWAQFGVGHDYVIARVETFTSWCGGPSAYEESLAMEAPPLRWFIARVP